MRRLAAVAAALLLATGAGAVTPGTKWAQTPHSMGLVSETVHFPSARDSVNLTGWWFEGGKDAPVVVVFPRGTGTMADLLPSVVEFSRRGYSVMTFDLRDFGPGAAGNADSLREVIFASRWVDDGEGAARFARSRAAGRLVFAWGQDIGGAVAIGASARQRNLLDAIACEGLFRTVQEQLEWLGLAQLPDVRRHHRILVSELDEPLSASQQQYAPLFVVLAMKDDVTPFATTRQAVEGAPGGVDYYTLPAAGHEHAELTPGYFDKLHTWFKWEGRRIREAQLIPH